MINREKVIADIEEQITWIRDNDFHKFPGWGHAVLAMQDALSLLKEQEAKTGHWIFESQYCEAWSHKCSECGKRMTTAVNTFANWCWNCGAEMKGEAEVETN